MAADVEYGDYALIYQPGVWANIAGEYAENIFAATSWSVNAPEVSDWMGTTPEGWNLRPSWGYAGVSGGINCASWEQDQDGIQTLSALAHDEYKIYNQLPNVMDTFSVQNIMSLSMNLKKVNESGQPLEGAKFNLRSVEERYFNDPASTEALGLCDDGDPETNPGSTTTGDCSTVPEEDVWAAAFDANSDRQWLHNFEFTTDPSGDFIVTGFADPEDEALYVGRKLSEVLVQIYGPLRLYETQAPTGFEPIDYIEIAPRVHRSAEHIDADVTFVYTDLATQTQKRVVAGCFLEVNKTGLSGVDSLDALSTIAKNTADGALPNLKDRYYPDYQSLYTASFNTIRLDNEFRFFINRPSLLAENHIQSPALVTPMDAWGRQVGGVEFSVIDKNATTKFGMRMNKMLTSGHYVDRGDGWTGR